MKAKPFLIVISVLVAALIGYGLFASHSGAENRILLSVGGGISMAFCLIGAIGVKPQGRTSGVNLAVLSAIFFILLLVSNLIFAFTAVKTAPYIIVNGILLLIYMTFGYLIIKSAK